MARHRLPPMVGGLNTLVDPLAGNPGQVQDCANIRVNKGLISQRRGFRILDREPSNIDADTGSAKNRIGLSFAATSSEYGAATITAQAGVQWTCLFECAFANVANEAIGTLTLLDFKDSAAVNSICLLQVQGDGTDIRLIATIWDKDGNSLVMTTAYKNRTVWTAALSSRFIRIVRDGTSGYLYVGETQEATDTDATMVSHKASSYLSVAARYDAGTGLRTAHSTLDWYRLQFINRLLDEDEVGDASIADGWEAYWGLKFPTDPSDEDTQILFNYGVYESTGTTVKDWSIYGNDMTLFNTPTWSGSAHTLGRGLGLFTHRKRNGEKWHMVAMSRCANDSSGNAPTGAIYSWLASQSFFPFYLGGASGAADTTALLDGLDLLARWQFLSYGDMCFGMNGVDYSRKFLNAANPWKYLSGTAPAHAPVHIGTTGTGSNWKFVQTWYNSATGTETAASAVCSTTNIGIGSTVRTWTTADTQFDKARVYRTVSGGNSYYLDGEVTPGALHTVALTDTDLVNQTLLPGVTFSGNGLVKRTYLPGGPLTAPAVADAGVGNLDAGVHYYAYAWRNSTTGAESGMSAAVAMTAAGAKQGQMSGMVLPPAGSQYDQTVAYRTKAGAYLWYEVAAFTAAATYNDGAADSTLTTTLVTKALPPKCRYAVSFAGRVFMAGDPDYPSRLYWSTAGFGEDFSWEAAHDANPGSEVTGLGATEGALTVHYSDGRVYMVPHPGDQADLYLFMPLNMREWGTREGAVGHYTIQRTPWGLTWLGREGFYRATDGGVELLSPQIAPSFLNLNRQRAKFAVSLYDDSELIYRCWVSRGNSRENDTCFVLDLRTGTWGIDDGYTADAAAVLIDGAENRHYCAITTTEVLYELREDTSKDGDGSGTLSGSVSGALLTAFTDLGSRTAPPGDDSGYPVWFVKSDGTVYRRSVVNVGVGLVNGKVNFYPSLGALGSGTWTVYFHGIRGRFRTMKVTLNEDRLDKTVTNLYIAHGIESAGTLTVKFSRDEGSQENANGSIDLSASLETVNLQANCRNIDVEVFHSPPAAGEHWRVYAMELEGDFGGDTA